MKINTTLSSLGAIYGIYYGVTKGKSFWSTTGFAVLFAIGGASLGYAYQMVQNKN